MRVALCSLDGELLRYPVALHHLAPSRYKRIHEGPCHIVGPYLLNATFAYSPFDRYPLGKRC
jgi:hypothetical protein